MSPNLAAALAAAEALSGAKRRELIELLLQGLDHPPLAEAEVRRAILSEAWRQEIARRSADHEAGRAETVSWREVQTRWQSRRAGG
jgi:putative addiction module component (TIGR02574 family)